MIKAVIFDRDGVIIDSEQTNVISATANIPVDRVLRKLQNIDGALFDDVEFCQRVSMMLGYQDWELGIESEYQKKKKSKKSSGKVIIP